MSKEREAEQPTIEICDCKSKYSIEPRSNPTGYTLYFGRCGHRHGYNLATISDTSHNCELGEILRLLNREEDK